MSSGPLPQGTTAGPAASGKHDFVQMFATRLSEVSKTRPTLLKSVTDGATVWVAYPKRSSGIAGDLSRDVLCAEVVKMGWLPVSIVAVDQMWSALRFRPRDDVKSKSV